MTGAAAWPPPKWVCWPARSAWRPPCSATASAPAMWTSSPLAMNMYTQGVDPELDFIRHEHASGRCTSAAPRCRCRERQPYAGELVFTAFSGSHQDAINKGIAVYAGDRHRLLGDALPAHRPRRCGPAVRADYPHQLPVRQGRRGLMSCSTALASICPRPCIRSSARWCRRRRDRVGKELPAEQHLRPVPAGISRSATSPYKLVAPRLYEEIG